jgi:hypothetical protein
LGQFDQAGPVLVRARDLAPHEPAPWITLIQFLSATGQKEKARAECQAAALRFVGNESRLALAECYASAEMLKEAKEHYDAAVKATPTIQ